MNSKEVDKEAEEGEKVELATREGRAIFCLRFVVAILLLAVATTACLAIYFIGTQNQVQDFEDDFRELGAKLVESFEITLKQRVGVIDEFSQDLTAYAINSNSTWPNVTLPNYEVLAGSSARLADLLAFLVVPFVAEENRDAYEQYTKENIGWRAEGMALQQGKTPEQVDVDQELEPIYDTIVGVGPEGPYPANPGQGIYTPIWQVYPAIPAKFNVMVNLYEEALGLKAPITRLMELNKLVMPRSYDFLGENANDPRKPIFDMYVKTYEFYGINKYENDPAMTWFYPVFDSLDPNNRNLVAFLVPDIYWKTYFRDILPSNANGIIVVLENSCGQMFTYRVDGKIAKFVDRGDVHDPKYDHLESKSGWVSVLGRAADTYSPEDAAAGIDCQYGVRVYPSNDLEKSYYDNSPKIFSASLAAAFVFTTFVFMLYEYFIYKRQQIVLKSAMQSGQLVSSLFPEDVRKRIYEEQSRKYNKSKGDTFKSVGGDVTSTHHASAIATLYPNCSVFFADIAGFTKWSANHTPAEVFDLLETLYSSFDKLAKKLKVFKIETIGDCYVATSGLPNDQGEHEHAVIIAKFAYLALLRFNDLLPDLADRLGPEITTLAFRVGIHSGPVTAGVLRGDKSRFQIFGDTVNTASRMESTGQAGKIQVSEATAKALRAAGKADWVVARDGLVAAKGKGEMQTYWAQPQVHDIASSQKSSNIDGSVRDSTQSTFDD